jgi:hypothetical protein
MKTEDMMAVEQVIARYAYAFDSGDADAWADTFCEDGVWEMVDQLGGEPRRRLVGRAELAAFCTHQFTNRAPGASSFHHQSSVLFEKLTADTARTRTLLILSVKTTGERPRIQMTGIYHDDWLRAGAGWRLQRRVLTAS